MAEKISIPQLTKLENMRVPQRFSDQKKANSPASFHPKTSTFIASRHIKNTTTQYVGIRQYHTAKQKKQNKIF
jgi:hypothetical protein